MAQCIEDPTLCSFVKQTTTENYFDVPSSTKVKFINKVRNTISHFPQEF